MLYCRYFVLFFIVGLICGTECEIVNIKVLQNINIETQFVKINAVLTIKNLGLKYVNEFIYMVDPGVHDFYIKFRDEQHKELKSIKITHYKNQTKHGFKVFLDRNLSFNGVYIVKVQIVYIDQIVPLYKTITFEQDQFVLYTGNLLYYSPYKTVSLENTYVWEKVENLQLSHYPHHQYENNMTFSYKNLQPFSFEEIRVEFKNNNAFMVVTNLERVIDVSHFGAICIEDKVTIKNSGSKLVGPYECKLRDIEKAASGWWYTHLPTAVEHVEYFDTIGLNSKSALLYFKNYKTFKFQPRYPLLSGWKTFYTIKYCIPVFEYLYHDFNGYFVLRMRAVDHILNDVLVRKATTKVLLPEAAQIIKADVPFAFTRLANEKQHTRLCTFGRPTVVLNGSNILENHITDFTVEYLFPSVYLFRVPLMLVLYLEIMYLFFIIISHIK